MSYAMVSAFQQDILKLFVVFFFYNDAKFLLNGKAGKIGLPEKNTETGTCWLF